MKHVRSLVVFVAALMLAGCASQYPNTYDKNIIVNLTMEKPGLLTTAKAVIGVNDMSADCKIEFLGKVDLVNGPNKVGLAPGQLTNLVLDMSLDTFGGPSRGIRRTTWFKPAAGKQYEIDVSYIDSMFDLRLYEITGSKRKELSKPSAPACKPAA